MNEDQSSYASKVVVVTGASGGIGRATAREFGRHGWRVALLARGIAGLQAAKREVELAGGTALILTVDIADKSAIDEAAAQIVSMWGKIDVWVNNAMATVFGPVEVIPSEDFKRVTDVTYLGSVWGTLAALTHMRPRNTGVIVQVGSALAYRSIPLQAAYCGAKSALRGFTDSLRSELLHDRCGVKLTSVHLSAFNTPQFDIARSFMPRRSQPMGTIFQPEIAARAIYRAGCSPRREFWIGWPAIQAIVGNKFMPGYLDKKMAKEAYEGQLSDEKAHADPVDNLYTAIQRDYGAHGRFDTQARRFSFAAWLSSIRMGFGSKYHKL